MATVRRVTDEGVVVPLATTSRERREQPLLREAIGHVLREARTSRGERLVDVSQQAGSSPQYLSEVERGAKDPSSEVLRSVSEALDLYPAEVVRRASTVMTRPVRRTAPASAPTALCLAA